MNIYILTQDNYIVDFSVTEKEGYDSYDLTDNDFFMNYKFYTVVNDKIVLREEYKKLAENEYLVIQSQDNKLRLAKPFIEHVNNIFVTLTESEEDQDMRKHISHYYNLVDGTVTLDETAKEFYMIDANKGFFRKYRDECFENWDIQKSNSLIGLGDPITEEDKTWYLEMLAYTDSITAETTARDWPVTPDKFKPVY